MKRAVVRFPLAAGLAAVAMAAIPSAGAQAAIAVPGSVADLVAAMNAANGDPGADTLSLAEGCTYALVAADNGANAPPAAAPVDSSSARLTTRIHTFGTRVGVRRGRSRAAPSA